MAANMTEFELTAHMKNMLTERNILQEWLSLTIEVQIGHRLAKMVIFIIQSNSRARWTDSARSSE
ncbi:MAG: hypothetical protein A2Z16_07055 [Chloroflexi bacterium RBG_16_54_18]|nr:MAG: hypothetical protein A2Z16_07055 [Chloroflexi bacterium RBG_16_54_18]